MHSAKYFFKSNYSITTKDKLIAVELNLNLVMQTSCTHIVLVCVSQVVDSSVLGWIVDDGYGGWWYEVRIAYRC